MTRESEPGGAAVTRPLRSRIRADPGDEEARRRLVALYRELGHPDQAGRYAVAIDGLATGAELRAYGALLRGLEADETRMRVLSRLPKGAEIPADVRDVLAAKATPEPGALLGTALVWLWGLTVAAVCAAPLLTFLSVLLGLSDSRTVAVLFTFIALGAGLGSSLCTSAWFAVRRDAKAALAWFLVSGVITLIGVLLPR